MPSSNNGANRLDGNRLTARELEVLALVADGKSTGDIAAQLAITPATIKTHLTSVYRKIGAQNRVQAARHYLDHLGPTVEGVGAPLSVHGPRARRPARQSRALTRPAP